MNIKVRIVPQGKDSFVAKMFRVPEKDEIIQLSTGFWFQVSYVVWHIDIEEFWPEYTHDSTPVIHCFEIDQPF